MSRKIKTTITLAEHIKGFASEEAKSLGLDFSAYITVLIAEKMRGVALTAPSRDNAVTELGIERDIQIKDEIVIDKTQEDEIDRLLEL